MTKNSRTESSATRAFFVARSEQPSRQRTPVKADDRDAMRKLIDETGDDLQDVLDRLADR